MSDSSAGPVEAKNRKRALLRLWLTLTAAIGIATFLFYRLVWDGLFATDPCSPSTGCTLGPALSTLTSFVFASGLALLIAILWQSRGRYRQVFRMSRARLIGAAALAALTPLTIFSGVPWILLPTLLFGVAGGFLTGSEGAATAIPLAVVTLLVATAVAYPISCLLVSGLRKRLARLAGFALVWWSAYCFVLMLLGLRKFML